MLKGRNATVVAHAEAYLLVHKVLTVSVVSVMEMVRGFEQAGMVERREDFLGLLASLEVVPLEVSDGVLAGRIDGAPGRLGQTIGRADVMIAAQAIARDWVLVSENVRHYERVVELGYPLRILNWREPDGYPLTPIGYN